MSNDIPKIYVADIVIEATIPGRGKNSVKQKRSFNLKNLLKTVTI